jgi:hypothetical protein
MFALRSILTKNKGQGKVDKVFEDSAQSFEDELKAFNDAFPVLQICPPVLSFSPQLDYEDDEEEEAPKNPKKPITSHERGKGDLLDLALNAYDNIRAERQESDRDLVAAMTSKNHRDRQRRANENFASQRASQRKNGRGDLIRPAAPTVEALDAATCYAYGEECKAERNNKAEAAQWLRLASNQAHGPAQFAYGSLLYTGCKGLKKNVDEAARSAPLGQV